MRVCISFLPSRSNVIPYGEKKMEKLVLKITCLICAMACTTECFGQESQQADSEILFVRRVFPIIREKCLGCHGNDPESIEGRLDMRSSAGLLAGGDSGIPSLIVGRPDHSPMYLAAARQSEDWSDMPPKEAEKLSPQQLAWLGEWIASGAAWPDIARREEIERNYVDQWSAEDGIVVETSGGLDKDWTNRKYDPAGLWAYQPVRKPALRSEDQHRKKTDDQASVKNPIDQLIEQSLPDGLILAKRADRRSLIRRATFDLLGLPPTPDEVHAFVTDPSPDQEAFEKVIDRLLESPHYGERMAQHWLDVVRYADSSGFANDFERGNAWRYRDYVVRAFNDDKPYDQFVREQIAGDEIDPQNPESIVATGFLRMGPWELTGMEVAKIARQRFLDDVTNSVGETFLGHSLQCARCHDHKFDPVPTKDYYSIQAVFGATQLAERKADFQERENLSGFEEESLLRKTKQSHEQTLVSLDEALLDNAQDWYRDHKISPEAWDKKIADLKQGGLTTGFFNAARADLKKDGLAESQYPPRFHGFTPEQFGRERVARKGIQRLIWELDRYRPYALAVYNGPTRDLVRVSAPTRIPTTETEQGELEQTAILVGGDPFSPADKVAPGTLSVIDPQVSAAIPDTINGRRTAFADWVASANNPLTTRVIANRIWQWHFDQAIAGNPNNFGSTGKRPTHPELLDWLASTLVNDQWSIKSLHRRIMMSDVYCRSSEHTEIEAIQELDPQGTSYAVFKPRRLSAEELRDTMLAVSGELNTSVGGIPCRPEINQEVALQPRQVMGSFAAAWIPNPKPADRNRRSIYVLRLRGLIDPMLEVFNSPSPDFSCEQREASTVTPQVFSLFNGKNTHARALALADRARRETNNDHEAIKRCFQLTLAREPTEQEVAEFLQHWRQTEDSLPKRKPTQTPPPLEVVREAVEENTGETFTFSEKLYSNIDYIADLQLADVDRHTWALSDACLVILNCNEFIYVY